VTQAETVEALRAKVGELEDLLARLGHQVVDSALDAARARIDTLRVRANLGRMDARDEVDARFEDAAEMLQRAHDRFAALTDESEDVGTALVEGLESARDDLEAAVQLVEDRVGAETSS
jgi:predicted nuclease with TOPRIM domain